MMKRIIFGAILWLVVGLIGFLQIGCAIQARVSGLPRVEVSPDTISTKGGKLRKIFPPNNLIVVTNSTGAPVVLSVYEPRSGSLEIKLEAGRQAELPFRQFHRSEVVIIASIYNPESGEIMDSISKKFRLTDNGSNIRTHSWVVRTNSSKRIIY